MNTNNFQFTKDEASKTITVVRNFDAPVDTVWKYWTQGPLLDTWWAPKPWKAETKKMDFRQGGNWLYAMVGPDGEKNWCITDFEEIDEQKSFKSAATFCDENGNKTADFPTMYWNNTFKPSGNATTVTVVITFSTIEAMNKYLDMGFEEGFKSGLGNLDEELKKD